MSQACAHFGGICVGTDIDVRVLKGKAAGRNVFTNFGAVEGRPLASFERGRGTVGGDLFLIRDALWKYTVGFGRLSWKALLG